MRKTFLMFLAHGAFKGSGTDLTHGLSFADPCAAKLYSLFES